MTMLTWALEHPYLYTMIKLKPAIVAVAIASIARVSIMTFRRK